MTRNILSRTFESNDRDLDNYRDGRVERRPRRRLTLDRGGEMPQDEIAAPRAARRPDRASRSARSRGGALGFRIGGRRES